MFIRSLIAACVAVVLFAAAIETAEAYPVTARRATTTVTGVYRPLDLQLSLVDGTDALTYTSPSGPFGFSATFDGTYSGYTLTGAAGTWQIDIGTAFTGVTASNTANTISLSVAASANAVGRLTYISGGNYGLVPPEDTPAAGDYFEFFASNPGVFLQVNCQDGVGLCNAFDLTMSELKLFGPYATGGALDTNRLNEDCGTSSSNYRACGSVNLSATSIPEPASLALVGVALTGLALVRRRHRTS